MKRKFILIAEDEVAYGKILKIKLEEEGYEVAIALNGDELLKKVRIKKCSLVVLDLVMPVRNGFQVLSEMKNDEQLKTIPVMVLSNLGEDEDIERAKKLGADDFLIKSDETFYNVITKIKKFLK